MHPIENYPQGYWKSGSEKFINKYQALIYGDRNNLPVDYIFFDHIWQNFDRSLLGKSSLQTLYKQRAQQLRDKYDYLILYFSGGADSWNVLRSFLDNNIHIDEVCVKWCTDTINSNIYTPNTTELSAFNYLSEWDYAIKPALEWLSQNHPKVKIEIVDWFNDKSLAKAEEMFNIVNHWHDIEINSLAVWSPSENALLEKGLRVGSIYGVDKPALYYIDNDAYMYFPDGTTAMGTPNPNNVFGTEYFYWAHEMPLLTFEMAYQVVQVTKVDPELASFSVTSKNRSDKDFIIRAWQFQQKRLRSILYDNWTNRFQAYKPIRPDRSDKHWWIYKHPELGRYKEVYEDFTDMHLKELKNSIYRGYVYDGSIKSVYRLIPSKRHFVCSR